MNLRQKEEVLHSLRELDIIMCCSSVAYFQLKEYWKCVCENSDSRRVIETAMERHSEEKRLRLWTSNGFKVKNVSQLAELVAFQSLFQDCVKEEERSKYLLNLVPGGN